MDNIANTSRLIRHWILEMTTHAGSGHPTSSLSAVELMAVLFFGGFFRFDIENPDNPGNDRLIFSKGHASPLFYALWAAAGAIDSEELNDYRSFASRLEGHPMRSFPFTEIPTGSLGQGLGAGLGMALSSKLLSDKGNRVFVLLGDGEIAEGSVWEAAQIASHYRLDNLIALVDASRLGQRGETMVGTDIETYRARFESFGWRAIALEDGHDIGAVRDALTESIGHDECSRPTIIIARTVKGKGVSFLEDAEGWHGKALDRTMLEKAKDELGVVDTSMRLPIARPETVVHEKRLPIRDTEPVSYRRGEVKEVRKAYGVSVAEMVKEFPRIVVLDAEVGNSTYACDFKDIYPERFFEMFIAEQNMVSAGIGLARRGHTVFLSSFGAFLTRAFDQIRMAQYALVPVVIVGSHVGVSTGQDGASQMALEDIAMMRPLLGSVVLYPSDAQSMRRLLRLAADCPGIVYIRSTRAALPVLYDDTEEFIIGGSKLLRTSPHDEVTIVACGITLHEALRASDTLAHSGINTRVLDLYSIKPVDGRALIAAARDTGRILTVEDHYAEGGVADAVREALSECPAPVYSLSVRKMPKSGKPEELIWYEEIGSDAIIAKVKSILSKQR